jgi:hypothetical protein
MATCADRIGSKGTKLYYDAAAPATHDAAGFDALTWADRIGLLQTIGGGFGPEATANEFELLEGVKCKYMGSVDQGEISLTVGMSQADAALVALRAKVGSNDLVSLMIETSFNGAAGAGMKPYRIFMRGKVRAARNTIGGVNDSNTVEIILLIEGDLVYADAVDGT